MRLFIHYSLILVIGVAVWNLVGVFSEPISNRNRKFKNLF